MSTTPPTQGSSAPSTAYVPNQQLLKDLEPGKKDSDGTKATLVELRSTYDSAITSAALQGVNANQDQAKAVSI